MKQIHKTECIVNRRSIQTFPYENPTSEFGVFHFTSSNEEVMSIRSKQMSFESRESRNITVDFHPAMQIGSADVLLYVNDQQGKVAECYLIKVNYIS